MFDHPAQAVMPERQLLDIQPERCAFILELIEEGWLRTSKCPEVNPATGEVEITERLRDSMREVLKGQVASWGRSVWVLPGTESRSTRSARRPDGITDIPIAFTQIRAQFDDHDPHAIIECKRIAGSSTDLCRLYVVEGIDRFKTGKYGGNHTTGFMAGYLLSGSPRSATCGINRYLDGRKRRGDRLGACWLRDEPWARSSVHRRPHSIVPITLHHTFCWSKI